MLAGSGYAHRDAAAWALPVRAAGAQLIQDLHPHDRGPKGTHDGAIIINGNLYCWVTVPSPGNWPRQNASNRASTCASVEYLQPTARFYATSAVIASASVMPGSS